MAVAAEAGCSRGTGRPFVAGADGPAGDSPGATGPAVGSAGPVVAAGPPGTVAASVGRADGSAVGWSRLGSIPLPVEQHRPELQLGGGADQVQRLLVAWPGMETTMLLPPWRVTSASVTPVPLTR